MNQILGKVAEVLTDRQLVINRGLEHGVEIGMQFAIMGNRTSEIHDPESGEVIGAIDIVKTIVKIVQVEEKLSVGKTFRTLREEGGAFSINREIHRAFKPSTVKVETLEEGGRFSENEINPEKSYVKVGDSALQVVTPEPLSMDSEVLSGVSMGTKRVKLDSPQQIYKLVSGTEIVTALAANAARISSINKDSSKILVKKSAKSATSSARKKASS